MCDVCVPYATAARALSEYYLHNSFFDNKFLANVKAIANILEQRERVEKKIIRATHKRRIKRSEQHKYINKFYCYYYYCLLWRDGRRGSARGGNVYWRSEQL